MNHSELNIKIKELEDQLEALKKELEIKVHLPDEFWLICDENEGIPYFARVMGHRVKLNWYFEGRTTSIFYGKQVVQEQVRKGNWRIVVIVEEEPYGEL